jgi:uncharacterized membrane protein (DUF441 family)
LRATMHNAPEHTSLKMNSLIIAYVCALLLVRVTGVGYYYPMAHGVIPGIVLLTLSQ